MTPGTCPPSIELHFTTRGHTPDLPPPDGSSFGVKLTPGSDPLASARRMVTDFCKKTLPDPSAASRIALATHELLANATKYSIDGSTVLEIEVSYDEHPRVAICARNRTDARNRATLSRIISEIDATRDPFEYYRVAMERSFQRTGGSGLGLARIRAEADMEMMCEWNGDEACIIAESRV